MSLVFDCLFIQETDKIFLGSSGRKISDSLGTEKNHQGKLIDRLRQLCRLRAGHHHVEIVENEDLRDDALLILRPA